MAVLAGYQGMKQREATIPLPHKIRLIEALERLVRLYEATGNKNKAREWQKELTEAKDKKKDYPEVREGSNGNLHSGQ